MGRKSALDEWDKKIFDDLSTIIMKFQTQFMILKSVQVKFESSLFDIKQLLQADLLDSEIDSSKELLKNGYLRASGVIAGVVLETHLSQVCNNHNITIKKNPKINDFNEILKQNNVIMEFLHGLDVSEIFNREDKPVAIKLEERIKKVNSKSIMHYYLTFYRMVSTGVHSSPDILTRYLIFDKNRLMKELHWGPEAEECEIAPIFASIHFMIMSLEYIHEYFSFPKKGDISKFWEKTQELGNKYKYFS